MSTSIKPKLVPGIILATSVIFGAASGAAAQDASNSLTLGVVGDENVLYITQSAEPLVGSLNAMNQMEISISGNRNGGAEDGWLAGMPENAPLMPGQLIQSGFGNMLSLNVQGDGNLFAISQTGGGNQVSGQILGNANQAMVVQTGMHNLTVFSQTGQGNTIMVSQSSL